MDEKSSLELVLTAVAATGGLLAAIFAFFTWKVYKRIEWLTGAMETHSDLQVTLAARRLGIPTVLHDPRLPAGVPRPIFSRHGDFQEIRKVRRFVPQRDRYRTPRSLHGDLLWLCRSVRRRCRRAWYYLAPSWRAARMFRPEA